MKLPNLFTTFFSDQQGNITAITSIVPQANATKLVINKPIDNCTPIAVVESAPTVTPVVANDPTVKKESRLKHFFSPIRKKQPIPVAPPVPSPMISQPDVFISNILPSNLYVNPSMLPQSFPPESSIKSDNPAPSVSSPTSSFQVSAKLRKIFSNYRYLFLSQNGGNLEELLFDIEALSKDIMELQTQCTNSPTDNSAASKKPFRSELNLVLSYPNQSESGEFQGTSSENSNSQVTPPVPLPMELITPSVLHTNPLYLQNLPPPFPSNSIPSSPLTPPTNFKTTDVNLFDKAPDYSHLKFTPINAPLPTFSSNNSIFCTVSAPSTPASDRKCIDKFCINETNNEGQRSSDKKKAKRVSIVNTKDDGVDKISENPETSSENTKEGDGKDKKPSVDNGNHHSHMHRNHSHGHLHPKRRMSLDNNLVSFD